MKRKKNTVDQAKDTGLAIILILLLFIYFGGYNYLLLPAVAVLIFTMTWPIIFRPLARFWFGLSNFLGGIASKILLTAIFFIIATPVGLLHRLVGADNMRMREWKQEKSSVFTKRDHTYIADDIKKPY